MHGIFIVNKPRGVTSHDVVDRVRALTGEKRVGHAGTLDPLAEGLLIVLIGREMTRRQAEFMAGEKEYVATITLGATSLTDDAEGTIQPTTYDEQPTTAEIEAVLRSFIGDIEQVPPAYSAIKVRGRKAYELARSGIGPKLEPRRVHIRKIELLDYRPNDGTTDSNNAPFHLPRLRQGFDGQASSIFHLPQVTLRVTCSKGTYIRSLARDIGEALGCGAYLSGLTRTRSGDFSLDDAVPLADLTRDNWNSFLLLPS